MKRFSYFAIAALLTLGLSMPGFSQAKKSAKADPCASQKAAVKSAGKDAAKKKSAQADLKTCMDQQKQQSGTKKKGGK